MSFDIWPPITPTDLAIKEAQALERELAWITKRTLGICRELKAGLEGCYALLAPADQGSTLVMSTPRNEKVKGTITRVGTRIVKGSLGLQLRMAPPQVVTLAPSCDVPIRALEDLATRLAESIELLGLILLQAEERPHSLDAQSLSSVLRLLADSIASSAALLKGADPSDPLPEWTTDSVPPEHFTPPLSSNLSLFISVRECTVVLSLRVLERLDAPVRFSTKLGLALGTLRRLEHDEMDVVFKYKPTGERPSSSDSSGMAVAPSSASIISGFSGWSGFSGFSGFYGPPKGYDSVHVREKVRVESADPSLISLHSKLGYLSIMLAQARRNLAAVMNVELES